MVPITSVFVRKNNPRTSSKALTMKNLTSGLELQTESQPLHAKLDDRITPRNQNLMIDRPSPIIGHSLCSVYMSPTPKTPGSKPKTQINGICSAQKVDSSPLRERRMTRSSIPRRSPSSFPRSKLVVSGSSPHSRNSIVSRGSGENPKQCAIAERKQPSEWKKVGEIIGELYRMKSQEIFSLHEDHHKEEADQLGQKCMTKEKPAKSPGFNKHATGPAISRKQSKISSLKPLFNEYSHDTSRSQRHLVKSMDAVETGTLRSTNDPDNLSAGLGLMKSFSPMHTDLSVILERGEKSSSTSMTENTGLLHRDDEAHELLQSASQTISLSRNDILLQRSIHTLSENRETTQNEIHHIAPLTLSLFPQKLSLPSTEIEEQGQELIRPVISPTQDLPINILKAWNDQDRLLTPSLPEDTKLLVPKKRKVGTEAIRETRMKTPHVSTLLQPVSRVKPLQYPKIKPSLISENTNDTLPIPSSQQRLRMKSTTILDRMKLFERKDPDVCVKPDEAMSKGCFKVRTSRVPSLRQVEPKGIEATNPNLPIRRVLSANTINAIVAGFHALETGGKDNAEEGQATLEASKNALENIEPVVSQQAALDGTSTQISRSDIVIKKVECEMVSPKPVRLAEMTRMMMLCRGKADKSSHYRKH